MSNETPVFDDHTSVLRLLKQAQEVERDVREKVREVDIFLNQPYGQWEDNVTSQWGERRPRYQFDRCNDLVDDIAGEMEQADFSIKIRPAGGDATKDLAKLRDGLIRNIENLSEATDTYNDASRTMVSAGFDAWRVVQRWGDNNSFDQDLYIDPIADAVNSVWFDHNSTLKTREDAEYCFVLESITKAVYRGKFKDGSGQSISMDQEFTLPNEPDVVVIGEFLFKQKRKTRIVEMTNGSVYVDDEKFQAVQDELSEQGITVKRERMRELDVIFTRMMDGGGWLGDPKETVFEFLPVVPIYGNWKVTRKTPSYWGVVTRKMDAQRVLNYAESRKVEDTALAPVSKIMVTEEQIGSHGTKWKELNTSRDPALPYVHDPETPPPYKLGGAELNPGLESVTQSAKDNLRSTAGIDLLNGESPGLRSGVAVELEQNKGDTRNYKYTLAKRTAICHTGKILMRAIPKVYDTERQSRIINEDGSFDIVTLNQRIFDKESGQQITLNDLSQGLYDVTCDHGPAYKNRQSETAQHFKDVAEIDPSIIEEGRDVWYSNLTSPGMDLVAERVRKRMLVSGQIPEEQMTDEEKEFLEAQPPPQPDPVQVALEREADNADDKVTLEGIRFRHQELMDQRNADREDLKAALGQLTAFAEVLNQHADTWNKMREAMGLETISGPRGISAFIEQGGLIQDAQEAIEQ